MHLIIVTALILLAFVDASFSDLENRGISMIKTYRNVTAPNSLLCVVFSDVTLESKSLQILADNMKIMSSYCNFAIISYACSVGALSRLQIIANNSSATLAMYRCINQIDSSKFVPKPIMYDRLLDILRSYNRVWLLDEDISLENVNVKEFLHIAECAFWPQQPPMVVQPVVRKGPIKYPYLHQRYWSNASEVMAVSSEFIEIQMPMIHALFFDWFVRYLVRPFIHTKQLFSDRGFDNLYCKSALIFAKTMFGPEFVTDDYNVCAVIPLSSTAVTHVGLKTILKDTKFNYNMFRQHSMLKTLFPNFYQSAPSSLSAGKQVLRLSDQCTPPAVSLRKAVNTTRPMVSRLQDVKPSKSAPVDATKIYVLYFPQFHADSLNDKLWGPGFTDWDNVAGAPAINKFGRPLLMPTELGFYDLSEFKVRRAQAKLAKEYGVDGFIYHHYFFYEPGLGPTLAEPLERMLVDNEPDLPFALHWANLEWSLTWQGSSGHKHSGAGSLLQQQFFPSTDQALILEHYTFLKKFFFHKNYIKVNGVPLFMVYRVNNPDCLLIIQQLRQLAMADGFPEPGLHIPQFRHNIDHEISQVVTYPSYLRISPETKIPRNPGSSDEPAIPGFQGDFYYPGSHALMGNKIPLYCMQGHRNNETRPTYLSTVTTFDNTPRRNTMQANVWDRSWAALGVMKSFERDVVETLLYDMCCQNREARAQGGKFIVINAWNEWAEGMVMEPSNKYGRKFLEAVQNAKAVAGKVGCDLQTSFQQYLEELKENVNGNNNVASR